MWFIPLYKVVQLKWTRVERRGNNCWDRVSGKYYCYILYTELNTNLSKALLILTDNSTALGHQYVCNSRTIFSTKTSHLPMPTFHIGSKTIFCSLLNEPHSMMTASWIQLPFTIVLSELGSGNCILYIFQVFKIIKWLERKGF